MTSCGLVDGYQRFRAICRFFLQGIRHIQPSEQVTCSSDMLIDQYQSAVFTHQRNVGSGMLWEICVREGGSSQFEVGSSVLQYAVKLKTYTASKVSEGDMEA